jgi:hypothetical protein
LEFYIKNCILEKYSNFKALSDYYWHEEASNIQNKQNEPSEPQLLSQLSPALSILTELTNLSHWLLPFSVAMNTTNRATKQPEGEMS